MLIDVMQKGVQGQRERERESSFSKEEDACKYLSYAFRKENN
jgi:hypothetical protein